MTELSVGDRVTADGAQGTVLAWASTGKAVVEWDDERVYAHDLVFLTLVSDLMPVFLPRDAVAQVSEFWVSDAPNLHSVIGDACREAQAAEAREAALAAEAGD